MTIIGCILKSGSGGNPVSVSTSPALPFRCPGWPPTLFSGAVAIVLSAHAAQASPATGTFQVTTTVSDTCQVTTFDLGFGVYNPFAGSAASASTTLSVTCTSGTTYSIALDAGTGAGASVASRKMTSGAHTINYSLYKDSARTSVWGASSSEDVDATGNGSAQSYTVYGAIPAAQFVASGSYTDTVTVTVTY